MNDDDIDNSEGPTDPHRRFDCESKDGTQLYVGANELVFVGLLKGTFLNLEPEAAIDLANELLRCAAKARQYLVH